MTDSLNDKEDLCKRCGLCCHYYLPGHDELIKCKFLVKDHIDTKKYFCKIYKRRLGARIGPAVVCHPIRLVPLDFPGCPYNDGRPMNELHVKKYENDLKNVTKECDNQSRD